MNYEFRRLANWGRDKTPSWQRPRCHFRAAWSDTLKLLGRETDLLGAKLVVIEVDAPQGQIRRDGLYERARVDFPGVRISFAGKPGQLSYATDRYADWRDNVRAIAKSLEALRAVDRYGVSTGTEQYRGWLAIDNKPAPMSLEAAKALINNYGGATAALKATHPDLGGDPVAFRQVMEARNVLGIANHSGH